MPTCYAPVRRVTARRQPARLACIRHAASVDPEPGSNSPPVRGPARLAPDDTPSCLAEPAPNPASTAHDHRQATRSRAPRRCSRTVPRARSPGPVPRARDRRRNGCPHALAPSSAHEPSPALAGAPGAPATPAAFPPPSRPTAPVTTRRSVPPCPLVNVLALPIIPISMGARSPCIAAGRKSLTPLPGLLDRLAMRRRATCDLQDSFSSTWAIRLPNHFGRDSVYRALTAPSIYSM